MINKIIAKKIGICPYILVSKSFWMSLFITNTYKIKITDTPNIIIWNKVKNKYENILHNFLELFIVLSMLIL